MNLNSHSNPADESIGFVISTTARKLVQALTNRFQPYGITAEQWTVLNRLAASDGISQKELSERAQKDPTNITRILDQLERKGWITRNENPSDRRCSLLHTTPEGRDIEQQLRVIEADCVNAMTAGLSSEELETVRKALAHMNKHFT